MLHDGARAWDIELPSGVVVDLGPMAAFNPLATGVTIPHAGLGLVVPALLAALVLTFVPERLTLRMLSELRLIWSA